MNEFESRRRARIPETGAVSVQGALALTLPEPDSSTPQPRRGHDLVPVEANQRAAFETWAGKYLQSAVDVVYGQRTASQLVRWTLPDVFESIVHRSQTAVAAPGALPGPLTRSRIRPQVCTLHSSFVAAGVCEVAAVVKYGERFRAMAARFELLDGRMQCVALDWA